MHISRILSGAGRQSRSAEARVSPQSWSPGRGLAGRPPGRLLGSLLLCLLGLAAFAPVLRAQNGAIDHNAAGVNYAQGRPWYATLFGQSPIPVPASDLRNSARVYALLHDGKLELSLDEAIALALENNLDIVIQRYNLPIADTDILRAGAGQSPRGVSNGLVAGTPGGGAAITSGAGAGGAGAGGTIPLPGGAGAGQAGIVTSTLGAGPPVPNFDPTLTTTISANDATTPQSVSFITGTTQLVSHTGQANFTYQQAWSPGTQLSVNFTNTRQSNNDVYNLFNPTLNSGLTVTLTQPLLQGFGTSVNGRNLVIARNNREISDIAFRHQVEATVTQVEEIYWDTVSARDTVQVARESLATAQTILRDDERQLRIGTMIPLDVAQQQSVVANDQQSLTTAETNYEYQKLLLLNAVTKNMTDPVLLNAEVVPTDEITLAPGGAVEPVQDLVREALEHRPELAISRVNLRNQAISMKAIHNELLPSLNLDASYGANALAGVSVPPGQLPAFFGGGGNRSFVAGESGIGSNLSSLIQGNYPTYAVGLTLTIPIRNRGAQADAIRAQLENRQSLAQYQQSVNEIVLEVRQAQFSLQQDRAAVKAAQQAVQLDEQTLAADRKRVALGAGVISTVITDQSNLTGARQNLVATLSNYQIARVQMNELVGRTLAADRISIQEAETGRVTQLPQARR